MARDTATHKDCLGSSKYETMGTEASYLAKGQGERLLELRRTLAYFKQISVCSTAYIQPTSLITLHDELGKKTTYILAAYAGGLKILYKHQYITLITPQSPLGKALIGKQTGDEIEIKHASIVRCYAIIGVV